MNIYCTLTRPKLLGYFSIVEPLSMEFDQLQIRKQTPTTIGFKSESPSVNIHCHVIYPKLLGYFSIVEPLFMEFDQLLIRE